MTLEELQEQVDKDLKINDTELDLESLKTPQLHNKYLKHYNNFKLLLTRAESDYKILKRVKWEYYTGKASPQVYQQKPFNLKIMKSDIDIDSELKLTNEPSSCDKIQSLRSSARFLLKHISTILLSIASSVHNISNLFVLIFLKYSFASFEVDVPKPL